MFTLSNQETLQLSEKAIYRLDEEMRKRNKALLLEVEIRRDSNQKASVYMGFADKEDKTKSLHSQFGHFISDLDFLALAGGEISYEEAEGKFVYFPNIDLEWEDSPRKNIKQILANRKFTHQDLIWTSEIGSSFDPILKILKMKEVKSCYAKGKLMQIEFLESGFNEKIEEEISEWILNYFSYLYPPLAGSLQNPL